MSTIKAITFHAEDNEIQIYNNSLKSGDTNHGLSTCFNVKVNLMEIITEAIDNHGLDPKEVIDFLKKGI